MSKVLVLLLICIMLFGCDDPEATPDASHWTVDGVITGARYPVMSPDGQYILFTREASGGLYLWHRGEEIRVTGSGTAVRPDYTWSRYEPGKFAYSIPGLSDDAGVYVSSIQGAPPMRVTGHGNQPEFSPSENVLFFSGSPSDSALRGIWMASLTDGAVSHLTPTGERPRLNPSGDQVAYAVPQPGSNGATLMAKLLDGGNESEVARRVASYGWISDQELLLEVVSDTLALPITPVIGRHDLRTGETVITANSATRVTIFANHEYSFNRLNGDLLAELVVVSRDGMVVFPDTLTYPSGQSAAHFVAAGPTTSVIIRAF